VDMPWLSDEFEVVAIAADAQGRLWLGTKGAGLFCLQEGKFTSYTTTNGLPSNMPWSLFVDREDTLWVGTADGGLACLRDGRFVNIARPNGLAHNTVCHIIEDSSGSFWFSSPQGVFSARRHDLEAFIRGDSKTIFCTTYDQSDGMLSAACTCAFQPAGCITRDGRVLFPTLKGVAVLRPEVMAVHAPAPQVFIEEVTIGDKVYDLWQTAKVTTLPGRTQVEIRYTALNFTAPEKVRFRHRLNGLETAWVNGGPNRVVNYSYLPPGQYQFELQACNSDGLWSPQSASIGLIIPAYFWQTWWFIGAVLVTGAGSIALTVRRVEKAKLQRRLEREMQARQVELERARIARDFHDNVGSDLTHVIVVSELLKGDNTQPKDVEAHAIMIGNTARKAVQGLRTIIWAANPKNDTVDGLVQYISHYSYEFCEAAALSYRLDLPREVPNLPLIAEVRHNLFMVVKESLHNVLKHAHASEVRLSLKMHEGLLEIRVEDNGCGFEIDSVDASQSSGLANMRHRMEAIGAAFFITSSPGTGTSIHVRWAYPKDGPGGMVHKS
jgi:signal transduction histidine kinase